MKVRHRPSVSVGWRKVGKELLICPLCYIRTYVKLRKCDICGTEMVKDGEQ